MILINIVFIYRIYAYILPLFFSLYSDRFSPYIYSTHLILHILVVHIVSSLFTIYTNFLTLCVSCSYFPSFSTGYTLYTSLFLPLVYVGQEDGRLCSQSPGNGHPLLLPAGELGGQAEFFGLKPQDVNDVLHKFPVRPVAVQLHRQHDVLVHVQHWNQVVALEHEPDLPAPEDGEFLVLQL